MNPSSLEPSLPGSVASPVDLTTVVIVQNYMHVHNESDLLCLCDPPPLLQTALKLVNEC